MKKNNYWRFILQNSQIPETMEVGDPWEINSEEKEILNQLTRIFRCRSGDELILMNENYSEKSNTEVTFEISETDNKRIILTCTKQREINDPIDGDLGLVIVLPNKPSKLDQILMHCTELGVTEFILLNSDNSNFTHKLRMDRLEKIVREAVEQSERALTPKIAAYDSIDEYLKQKQRQCIVALERDKQAVSLLENSPTNEIDILVGPEGGFSEREIRLFNENKIGSFNLGRTILRSETAAILATGIISMKLQNPTRP
jgi:16S rRNA (uracil1498-N3)-methyltransferase